MVKVEGLCGWIDSQPLFNSHFSLVRVAINNRVRTLFLFNSIDWPEKKDASDYCKLAVFCQMILKEGTLKTVLKSAKNNLLINTLNMKFPFLVPKALLIGLF